MKKGILGLAIALMVGGAAFFGGSQEASAEQLGVRFRIGGGYGGYGGYYGRGYPSTRHYRHYRSGHDHAWHDTSHWDYHPGGFYRHGNHYHYQPGHYHWHQEGHLDHIYRGRRGTHIHHDYGHGH